ncbi:hemin uptake protein HemP [Schlegelella sp. S2-27]|uniref:Hemin uptake protein HemP n=1 Tax=Caldimonas mangrovi TaxID=2944811 RepID=A0ABT0YQB6_9BURK|nr:hemin uptake protein HemP [Caldimonas mangrovi]MCM5680933.1 hemin uptake protein HemP [Caldimonas mangrovi]
MKSSALVAGLVPSSIPASARLPSGAPGSGLPAVEAEPAVASSALLRGRKSIHIEHNGALYQLRATKFGKLILTK